MLLRCLRACCALVVVLAVPSTAQAVVPVWGAGAGFGVSGQSFPAFVSMACPAVNSCVAAGYTAKNFGAAPEYGPGLVIAQDHGVWAAPTQLTALPQDADADPRAVLTGIACTSTSSCIAVGSYRTSGGGIRALAVPVTVAAGSVSLGTPVAFTEPADATTTALKQNVELQEVSCGSATCTAVGSYVDDANKQQAMVADSSDWKGVKVDAPAAADDLQVLNTVSCAQTGPCEAAGTYEDKDAHVASWMTRLTSTTASSTMDVPLPADAQPTSTITLLPGLNLTGPSDLSCPSSGACTLVGSYAAGTNIFKPLVLPITDGQPGTFVALAGGGGAQRAVPGASCWAATDCAVIGYAGSALVANEESGVWSALSPLEVKPDAAITLPSAVACGAAARCAMAGIALTQVGASFTGQPFFAAASPSLRASADSVPATTVGQAYSATLSSSGGSGGPVTWAVSSGTLPAGLTLDAATGIISGVPTAAGVNGFVARATDAGPPAQTADASLTITVAAGPVVTPSPTPAPATPKAKIAIASVSTKGAKVSVILFCTGAPCGGRLKLATTVRVKKKGKKAKAVTLAKGSYATQVQRSQNVKLVLRGKAAKLLKQKRKLKAKLTVTPTGASKPAATRTITVKLPKPKRKRK
jgi:Putative Ig domain